MARYELILRLDGALWLKIILKSILTKKWLIKIQKWPQKGGSPSGGGRVGNVCLGPVRPFYIYSATLLERVATLDHSIA